MKLALLAFAVYATACSAQAVAPPPRLTGDVRLSPAQVTSLLEVEPVEKMAIGGALVTGGKIAFDDMQVAHVFSPVTGRVTRIVARLGQHVSKGEPLAVIQSPDVGSAFSDLAKAQADLSAAEHDYARQNKLYAAHAGSQKDYESAEDDFSKAKAELERAKQKARLLRRGGGIDRVSQEFTLAAPIDGEVVALNASPGLEVQGQYSGGATVELFTVGDLAHVWLLADVYESDLGAVHEGQKVQVKVPSEPGRIFTGEVQWISDALDPATHTAKIRCALANPERLLKPEMYASVTISVARQRALAVPRSALVRLGDQTIAFVEAPGLDSKGDRIFDRRPVAVDDDGTGEAVPVTHGLALGERVVTRGAVELLGRL